MNAAALARADAAESRAQAAERVVGAGKMVLRRARHGKDCMGRPCSCGLTVAQDDFAAALSEWEAAGEKKNG